MDGWSWDWKAFLLGTVEEYTRSNASCIKAWTDIIPNPGTEKLDVDLAVKGLLSVTDQWRIYIVKFWTRAPPPGVQILSISCSFWEILAKSYVGAPPPPPRRVGTLSSGKSWIRHCRPTTLKWCMTHTMLCFALTTLHFGGGAKHSIVRAKCSMLYSHYTSGQSILHFRIKRRTLHFTPPTPLPPLKA